MSRLCFAVLTLLGLYYELARGYPIGEQPVQPIPFFDAFEPLFQNTTNATAAPNATESYPPIIPFGVNPSESPSTTPDYYDDYYGEVATTVATVTENVTAVGAVAPVGVATAAPVGVGVGIPAPGNTASPVSTENATVLARYGTNPAQRGKKSFFSLPKTRDEAVEASWTEDSNACEHATYWKGIRYRLNGDTAISLIFDYQGNLAGIQSGFTPADPVVFPDNLVYRNVFNAEGPLRVGTVYFKHPQMICGPVNLTAVPSLENLGEETGDQLFIQTGPDALNQYAHIHKAETELISNSMWKAGSCLASFGRHYFFNITSATPCQNFVPMFLLFDQGELSGFGWAFRSDAKQAKYMSKNFEKLKSDVTDTFFMQNQPTCLVGKSFATLHFFFKPQPWEVVCS